jgi:hypothetical protein
MLHISSLAIFSILTYFITSLLIYIILRNLNPDDDLFPENRDAYTKIALTSSATITVIIIFLANIFLV